MPHASVVIPVYQRADMLAPCLAALEAAGLDDVELVLVDNGSTDPGVAPLLGAWEGSARVLRNPVNSGFAAACNQGARAASAPCRCRWPCSFSLVVRGLGGLRRRRAG